MSDAQHTEHEPNHEGPIRTPKQLIGAVVASFVVPIVVIIMLANFVDFGGKTGLELLFAAAGPDLQTELDLAWVAAGRCDAMYDRGLKAWDVAAGVVHQHIDAAELILNLRHHGIDHLAVGHVHQAADGLCAQRLALRNSGIHARLPQVADNHDGAFGGKFKGGGKAYALRCAGDDADFVQ